MTLDRPASLFRLYRKIETLDGVGPATAQMLDRLDIRLVRDLVFHLPKSVLDRHFVESVADVTPPAMVTVLVEIGRHLPARPGNQPYRIELHDARTSFCLAFFGSTWKRLEYRHPSGSKRYVSGRLDRYHDDLQMVHPDYILPDSSRHLVPDREPVYPLTDGLSGKVMSKIVGKALEDVPDLPEWHDPELLDARFWPGWKESVLAAHCRWHDRSDTAMTTARSRLSFDELMANQLALLIGRKSLRNSPESQVDCGDNLHGPVLAAFGHELTAGQKKVLQEITADIESPKRMIRLLQGDVGSGKTIVALLSLLAAVERGGQGVLLAPTEILVHQHYRKFRSLLRDVPLGVSVLTGRSRGSLRSEQLDEIASGETSIVLGTHAVLQEGVGFRDLRLVVVDEQHKFGVGHRRMLLAENPAANLLMMTATPIPRTLALTAYGDADISVLDERPAQRSEIRTAIIPARRTGQVIERLARAVNDGRQAYWICPLIAETDGERHAAAEQRADSLGTIIGKPVGLVHGRIPARERIERMNSFQAGETSILVATTVVEVGVDVPNASIMVIESAERFGLAQLHQLRGRVGRGEHESACVLIYNSPLGEPAGQRLTALRQTNDGFRIAEMDLALRGSGELVGDRQSGEVMFRLADPANEVAALGDAREQAGELVESDPRLETERGQAARALLFLFGHDRLLPALDT